MTDKAMTLRLDAEMAEGLGLVAEIDGLSKNDVIARAVAVYIGRRRQDPAFRAKLAAYIDRVARLLDGAETGTTGRMSA